MSKMIGYNQLPLIVPLLSLFFNQGSNIFCIAESSSGGEESSKNIKIVRYDDKIIFESGTAEHYAEDPIFYDTWVPILFDFPVPRHSEKAMKIMWDHAAMCNISDSRYDGKLCPVVHHLHKVVTNLSHDMGFWKPFYPDPSDVGEAKDAFSVKCDTISQHFDTYYLNQLQFTSYKQTLEKCEMGQFLKYVVPTERWLIDKRLYYTMIENFYREFYRHLPSTGSVDWVVTLNSYTALQGILLSNNYMESNRIHNAFSTCQVGKIPESFVDKNILQQTLAKMNKELTASHYKLLYDFQNNGVLSYYKLPLSECFFAEDDRFVIKVSIPLKRAESTYKLLEILSYPFIETVNYTKVNEVDVKLCYIGLPNDLRMIESSSGLLFESTCSPNQLCQTSQLNSFPLNDPCLAAIFSHSDDKIKEFCKLNCFHVAAQLLPIIKKIDSDKFVLVGTSRVKVFLYCHGQALEMLKLRDEGALKIVLPCDCHFSFRSQVFHPSAPCSRKLEVSHIMPTHWKNRFKPSNLSNPEEDHREDPSDNEIFSAEKQVSSPATPSSLTSNGQLTDGFIAQICLLWIVIVTLVGALTFMAYHVYKLVKWKEYQVYKDTRIVYNVPESPKLSHKT